MKSTKFSTWSVMAMGILAFFLFSCQKSIIAESPKLSKNALSLAANATASGENAAPSEHLYFSFPSDAIAKLHRIKITQSANAEYFSVHNYAGGYAGLQQTPDNFSVRPIF